MKQDKKDALDLLFAEARKDPEMMRGLEEAHIQADAAGAVFDLRAELGLSIESFAQMVNLSPTTVEDIEATDYDGDLLKALIEIAVASRRRVSVSLREDTRI